MAEIVRAGIQSVDPGQTEAAAALGMSRRQALRRIVLPQAMRVIIPPTGNETIAMLKDTSLVAFVPVTAELFYQLPRRQPEFQPFPMLVAATCGTCSLTSILLVAQYFVERHFSRGYGRAAVRAAARLRPRARCGCAGWPPSGGRSPARGARKPADTGRGAAVTADRWSGPRTCTSPSAARGAQGRGPGGARRARCAACSGPSGSGKSTFLRCINHLEKIDAGRIWVDGELIGYRERGGKLHELREKEVAAQRRDIGMVFQRFNLFPHMTALENVMEAPIRVKSETRPRSRAG